jgi:crotonobetainyl-CoA:carnitine CoA-transferase CaiB-like acyl-CoA transferase
MGTYTKPFEGIRILDFTQALAGVYCGWQLADLGADIWKVERYKWGDQSRSWPPYIDGLSALFASFNRNKRSISIDTAREEGRELVKELVKHVDVVLENFKVGTMEKLGIGYEVLSEINPRIVYGSVSGFGIQGPLASLPCYDNVAAARGGLSSRSGRPDGPPIKPGYSVCDNWTGLNLFNAVAMGLVEREKTGRGLRVDVSMTDCSFYVNDWPMLEYSVYGTVAGRSGNHDPNVAPYGEFAAKDGYIVLAITTEKTWKKFCFLMEAEELAEDPRFDSNANRLKNLEAMIAEIEKITRTKGKFQLEKLLAGNNVPCGAVMTIPEVMLTRHTQETGMLQVMDQAVIGKLFTTGIPMHFSKTPGAIRRASPLLGEHSVEILKEAGFSDDAIDALVKNDIVETYAG